MKQQISACYRERLRLSWNKYIFLYKSPQILQRSATVKAVAINSEPVVISRGRIPIISS